MTGDIEVLAKETLFRGPRFFIERVTERHHDGETHARDMVRHPGAVVILPVRDDGHVVLVEQHRTSIGGELLELPAGTLEPGEDPLLAAQRELAEETGYRAASWSRLVRFYPAPGICDELIEVFLATGLKAGACDPDPGESLAVREMRLDEVRRCLLENEIMDGKTLTTLLYVMFVGLESGDGEPGAGAARS